MSALRLGARLRLWCVLLCALFLTHSITVQAHVHSAAALRSVEAATSQVAQDEESADPDRSQDGAADYCFLCHEAATAGHYVAPAQDAIELPPATPHWASPPDMARWTLRQPHVGWFGRAPPR